MLTICTENPFFFRMKCQMEQFNPVKIFQNRRNAFKGIPLFSFQPKFMTGISCTICKNLTRAILSPNSKVNDFVNPGTSRPSLPSSTGLLLTNGTASYFDPFLPEEINCSICPKNPTQKSHAGPIVWAYNFITSWLCT